MKKALIRLTAFVLMLVLLAFPLASCSGVDTSTAVEYEKGKVSCATYQYLCSLKKTEYLYEAYGITSSDMSSSQLQDNPAIWEAKAADGTTVADTLKGEVLDDIKLLLYMKNVAEKEGYKLDSERKALVEKEFDKMVASIGSKSEFNKEMEKYGINYDQMLEYNFLQAIAYQGMQLLFGENGTMKVSVDAAQKYFKNNYATVSYLFINTKNKTYSNGKVVALPTEEKEAKKNLADDVFQKAKAGEDFASLVMNHSDLSRDESIAKDGLTFKKGGFLNSEAEKKIWEMKNGEIARVDTDGGVYILFKKSLNEKYFESAKESIVADLEEVKKFSLVSQVEDKFKLKTEFFNELDVAAIPHVV